MNGNDLVSLQPACRYIPESCDDADSRWDVVRVAKSHDGLHLIGALADRYLLR
jgi:hypothetical protein